MATIDSVGSQANRLEPIFKSDSKNPKDWLVPQIQIVIRKEACGECEACQKADGSKKNKKNGCTQQREVTRSLLDLAHRAADAVVQASPDLLKVLGPAFKALQRGDAGALRRCAHVARVRRLGFTRRYGRKAAATREVDHPGLGRGAAARVSPV